MPIGNPIRKQNESRVVSVLATEGQTVFTVQGGYIINHISVFRNGVRLSNSEDFTAGDGSTVTLNNAANIDDRIEFHVFDRFTVQNAIVSAASTQTISGDLVVNGKIFGNLDVPNINTGIGTFNGAIDANDGANITGGLTANQINLTGIVTATELDLNGKGDISGDLNVVGVTTLGKAIIGTGVTIDQSNFEVAGISTFLNSVNFKGNPFIREGYALKLENGHRDEFSQILNSGASDNANIVFQTGSGGTLSEALRIDPSGRLLTGGAVTAQGSTNADDLQIGANNQSNQTGITLGSASASSIRFSDAAQDSAGMIFYDHATNHLGLYANNSERLRIFSNGRVNIGAASSTSGLSPILHLHKNASNDTAYLHITSNDTGITASDGLLLGINALGDALVFNKDSTPLRFATANSERMRITSAGKVGINSTSPTYALEVDGGTQNTVIVARSSDAKAAISFLDNTTSGYGYATIGGEGDEVYITSGGGTERLRIRSWGDVNIAQKLNVTGISTFASDITVTGTVNARNGRFTDDGGSDPVLAVLADDEAPWGLVINNASSSNDNQHGLKFYVQNDGDVIQQVRGASSYKTHAFTMSNTSNSDTVMQFETDRSVTLRHQGNTKLQTTSDGVTVTGTQTATDFAYSSHPGAASFTGNNSTTTMTIASGHNVNSVLVVYNGVVLTPTTDYTISGTTLTFTFTPLTNSQVVVRYLIK